jgi:hypothetical protein
VICGAGGAGGAGRNKEAAAKCCMDVTDFIFFRHEIKLRL